MACISSTHDSIRYVVLCIWIFIFVLHVLFFMYCLCMFLLHTSIINASLVLYLYYVIVFVLHLYFCVACNLLWCVLCILCLMVRRVADNLRCSCFFHCFTITTVSYFKILYSLLQQDAFNRTWWSVLSIEKLVTWQHLSIEISNGHHVVMKGSYCLRSLII